MVKKVKMSITKFSNEKDAILACQSGQIEAYRYLVEKYKTRAYHTALMFTKNRDDALDLSQEAFVHAYRAIDRFDPQKNFYTWFYRILKNLCINYVNHKRNTRKVKEQIGRDKVTDFTGNSADNPEQIFEQNERSQLLWNALNALKDNDREIIILKDFDGMSYAEIADTLGIPAGSVMSRLYYARQRLLRKLEKIDEVF
ncbi:MAG TPA: sigma-70 family RNA polymerase sigma factor [Caldithrix abyssi]|uniref:Sigma-70 family RNA polymerase sigma factor n=1 Tax=Caldithrix abyssi TaxID=187145 RepID=A0A7V4U287_CALAY|nr:sigma-70 family RNA polymerase sigma factor [Caldithrix abyssi]